MFALPLHLFGQIAGSLQNSRRWADHTNGPSRRTRRQTAKHPRRLCLEALEDRYVLSTLTVTSRADDITQRGTLRYAVAHADNGDRILITPAIHGTIMLTHGELLLNKDLTIKAVGNAPATISGNNASRVFEVASNAGVTLSNLTITGGNLNFPSTFIGGAGIFNQGTLTLNHSSVSGNVTTDAIGAGIYNSGKMTLTSSIVSGNEAIDDAAGGIYNRGTLKVNDSTISRNGGLLIGAIWNDSGTVMINRSTISNNNARFIGGISNGGTLTINNSTVSGNKALGDDAGGIYNYGTATIDNSTLSGNFTVGAFGGGRGGGIWNGGSLTINDSTLSGNYAIGGPFSRGGGIYNTGTVALTNSILSGNYAQGYGGGIYNSSGTVTISNSNLFENSAESLGGFGGYGGGIWNGGTLTITNSTFSGNSASADGGGIYNSNGMQLTVSGSKFFHNTPDNIAGPFIDGGGNTFS